MGVTVESLARRMTVQKLQVREVRDALVSWFIARAEPQVRKGLRYTAPRATPEEVQRLLQSRARNFFVGLASSYNDPTWADLRRVKSRMDVYLCAAPPTEEQELWQLVLA